MIASGAREVELDWMELVGLGRAVARARAAGLARHARDRARPEARRGGLRPAPRARSRPTPCSCGTGARSSHFRRSRPASPRPLLHGDFSLNVTNSITAAELLARGLDTLTAAHDLDRAQLLALLDAAPRGRVTVVLHHHIPTFHTEHCVYAHLLSAGRDFRTCGRPCEQHEVALRDRVGPHAPGDRRRRLPQHRVQRQAQTAAELVPELLARGVRRFRVELVRESRAEAARVLAAYGELLAGRIAPARVQRPGGRQSALRRLERADGAHALTRAAARIVVRFGTIPDGAH